MLLHELFGNIPTTAPLYHFTTLRNFYAILQSDTLKAKALTDKELRWGGQGGAVSFTRDPRRAFIPANITYNGIGFRVDRNKLESNYKIVPHQHRPRGVVAGPTTKGSTGIGRNEAEERVMRDITNFSKYITGIVVPKTGKYSGARLPDIADLALTILDMSGVFSDRRSIAMDVRSKFLNTVKQLNVPIIFGGKEYSVEQVDKAIGKIFWLRKNKPEQFQQLFDKFFNIRRSGEKNVFGNVNIDIGRGTTPITDRDQPK